MKYFFLFWRYQTQVLGHLFKLPSLTATRKEVSGAFTEYKEEKKKFNFFSVIITHWKLITILNFFLSF